MERKHIYRILVIRIKSQYNALCVFEEELMRNWKNMGMVVDCIERGNPICLERIVEQGYDLIFVMSGAVFSLKKWCELDCRIPVCSYYVDHPLHLDPRIRGFNAQHCVLVDEDFKGYVDRHYSLVHDAKVVMQAGVEGAHSTRPFKERRYPIVFCGSFGDYHSILSKINEYESNFRNFLCLMIEEALKEPFLTIEKIYDRIANNYNLSLNEEQYTELLFECKDVELYLRAYYRAMVIKQLVEAGIPVEVYGEGWERLDCNRKDLLHCHASVDYREMLDVFADAQIVLNVMPWAKKGFHDRIACGMLNGALVISDETAYMREQQLDGNQLVLYTLDSLDEIPHKVAYYLEHSDEAEIVAQNGYKWAKENHTWRNRAEQLYEIFEKYN